MSKLPLEYLKHIIDETSFIISSTQDISEAEFQENPILKRAVVRSLEIIGEASKKLPGNFKQETSYIEWKNIARLRDKLIHHYFGVDYSIVWDIVINEIPNLHKIICDIVNRNEK